MSAIFILTAGAVGVDFDAGPYSVSLDMNGQEPETKVIGPLPGQSGDGAAFSMYQVWLNHSDSATMIVITGYQDQRMVTTAGLKDLAEGHLKTFLGCTDVTSGERTIDGHSGVVAFGSAPSGRKWMSAGYWPDEGVSPEGKTGTVQVALASCSTQEVKDRLLDSIHVELAPEE
ncbi:MAG: hypothetical protein GKC10_02130 [Methanosarcinales archaeon]|nr:hypothetical protein [Methanosarcinales archaeon]